MVQRRVEADVNGSATELSLCHQPQLIGCLLSGSVGHHHSIGIARQLCVVLLFDVIQGTTISYVNMCVLATRKRKE